MSGFSVDEAGWEAARAQGPAAVQAFVPQAVHALQLHVHDFGPLPAFCEVAKAATYPQLVAELRRLAMTQQDWVRFGPNPFDAARAQTNPFDAARAQAAQAPALGAQAQIPQGFPVGQTMPGQAVPQGIPVGQTMPGQAVPTAQGIPVGQAMPGQAVPQGIPVGQAMPGQAVPTAQGFPVGQTMPRQAMPTAQGFPVGQAMPGQAMPTAQGFPAGQAMPGQAVPTAQGIPVGQAMAGQGIPLQYQAPPSTQGAPYPNQPGAMGAYQTPGIVGNYQAQPVQQQKGSWWKGEPGTEHVAAAGGIAAGVVGLSLLQGALSDW